MTEHLKAKPIKKGDICLTLAVPIPEFYTEWGNLQNATYSIFCDLRNSPSCIGWVGEYQHQPEVRRIVRLEASKYGWKRKLIDGRLYDICPRCYETVKPE